VSASDELGVGVGLPPSISYGEARELAAHDDAAVRAALARRSDIRPEILYYLADDPSEDVRRAIAENATTPAHAHPILARDSSDDVRVGLARSLGDTVPDPSVDIAEKARQSTAEALDKLARDQITRVRQVLADTLKDVAHAPTDVINLLARDADIGVAGPVLEHSPVLTDDDLLRIITEVPVEGGLDAISRRQGVGGDVADAIVATEHVGAIAELLANESAQIREQTLDTIIDQAPEHDAWHEPLVKRPQLPPRGVTRLARFVADSLLDVLHRRQDLDDDTLSAVKEEVHRRLDGNGDDPSIASGAEFLDKDAPVELAGRLKQAGRLDTEIVVKALQASDFSFVVAALAVRSGLDERVVKRLCASRNTKGVVSLAWKVGLPMSVAVQLQQRLARIAPGDVLTAGEQPGYPLSDDEMSWQIEFFTRTAGGNRS